MSTYVAFADFETGTFQNAQELAAVWGDVRADLEDQGCLLEDAYVLLGDHDVLMILDADDREQALQASVAVERYGLSLTTMEAFDVDKLGDVVEEI